MSEEHWNKKVSVVRGSQWRANLVKGKLEARTNPSRLYKTRVEKEVPQNTIAAHLDVSLATYGAIERMKRIVKKDRALQIANYFKTKPENIFKKLDKDKFIVKT